jgi:FkbM family methyltransferase
MAFGAQQTNRVRRRLRVLSQRLGVEQEAVSAYEGVLRVLEGPRASRNRRDDERVRLLAAAVLGSDSNCIDVGANEGQLLATFTELAPKGRHIAYEPVPDLSTALSRRFPRVDVRTAALSDTVGRSEFVVNKRLPSRSGLRPIGDSREDTETITVRVESLDAALPRGYVPHLIKIDVEGAEHHVLRGALETLRVHRPVVVFEHQHGTARYYGSGPEQMFGLLVNDLGMRIFDLDGAGPYSQPAFLESYRSGRRWNFFAVPESRTVSR